MLRHPNMHGFKAYLNSNYQLCWLKAEDCKAKSDCLCMATKLASCRSFSFCHCFSRESLYERVLKQEPIQRRMFLLGEYYILDRPNQPSGGMMKNFPYNCFNNLLIR